MLRHTHHGKIVEQRRHARWPANSIQIPAPAKDVRDARHVPFVAALGDGFKDVAVGFGGKKHRRELAGVLARPLWVLRDDGEQGVFGVHLRSILPDLDFSLSHLKALSISPVQLLRSVRMSCLNVLWPER